MKKKYQFYIDDKAIPQQDPPDFAKVMEKALSRKKWWQSGLTQVMVVAGISLAGVLSWVNLIKPDTDKNLANTEHKIFREVTNSRTDSVFPIKEFNNNIASSAGTVNTELYNTGHISSITGKSSQPQTSLTDSTDLSGATAGLPVIKNRQKFRFKAVQAQEFLVDAERGSVIYTRNGTVITIPAQAFQPIPNKRLLAVYYREFSDAQDLLVSGLSTFNAQQTNFQTLGAFELKFTWQGSSTAVNPVKEVMVRLKTKENCALANGFGYDSELHHWYKLSESSTQGTPNSAISDYQPVTSPLLHYLGFRYHSKDRKPHWLTRRNLHYLTVPDNQKVINYQHFGISGGGLYGSFIKSDSMINQPVLLQNPFDGEENAYLWQIADNGKSTIYKGNKWPQQIMAASGTWYFTVSEYGDSAMVCRLPSTSDMVQKPLGWTKAPFVPHTSEELNKLRLWLIHKE